MAGGQSEEPCDRTWQVNAESGTLQGWGAITLPATSEPAILLGQTETQNVQYDTAKTSLRDDLCDVADPSKLQAPSAAVRSCPSANKCETSQTLSKVL